jgi:hypothetical protein
MQRASWKQQELAMRNFITVFLGGLLFSVTSIAAEINSTDDPVASMHKRVVSTERKSDTPYTQNIGANATIQRLQIQQDRKRASSTNNQTSDKRIVPVKYRDMNPQSASHSYWFEIYDARSHLSVDYDGDGYYSEFVVEFDADTAGGFADVYAELYLSVAGGAWVHYHTTNIFTIYGSDDDDYSIKSRLLYDFPTGDYDVLVDLYEAGYPGIVASIGPTEDGDLYALPLEDREHELGSNDTIIDFVSTELFGDLDHDGFFTELSVAYNIDTVTPGLSVYSEVILTHTTELWQYRIESELFDLHNQTELIEITLGEGFDAAWYDVEIQIVDNHSGQILAIAAQDFSSLTGVPLESIGYDDLKDVPDDSQPYIDGTNSVSSNESGGGGVSLMSLFLWLVVAARKKSLNCKDNTF